MSDMFEEYRSLDSAATQQNPRNTGPKA